MSGQSFNSIIANQFNHIDVPYIEAWYENGLDLVYPGLDPNSAIGHIAVELEQSRDDSEAFQYDCEIRYSDELDQIVYADEITSANQTHQLAEARVKVLQKVHDDFYQLASDVLTEKQSYQAIVSLALIRLGLSLDVGVIKGPPGRKPELLSLGHEVCCFLSLESTQHFKELDLEQD